LAEDVRVKVFDHQTVDDFASRGLLNELERRGAREIIGAALPGGFAGGFGYPYIAAKHAVIGLTKQFGLDGAAHGVRVNAICPGWIDTPLIDPMKQLQPLIDWAVQNTPLGRLGRPEEIAKAALFLASDDSSFMTGAYLVIDGGWTAR